MGEIGQSAVSVIIPAYNVAHCLRTCLDSVFGQTLPPHEVIVVNDGSTDATAAVARGYGDRIRYREQPNAGQGAARNVGLSLATGEFIAFLDADDYWKPAFLERCVRFLAEHPEAVAGSTGLIFRLFNGTERIQPACLRRPGGPKEEQVLEDFFAFWAEHDHIRTGSCLMRRSALEAVGRQREDLRIAEDLELWGMLGTHGSWGFIPEPLWVGNSRAAARRAGWLRKYRQRRHLCPTVESWQERILPRLRPRNLPHFNVVRGRVALGLTHAKVLGGDWSGALDIVRRYGPDMPAVWSSRVLRAGCRWGRPGWWMACGLLIAREWQKAAWMGLAKS